MRKWWNLDFEEAFFALVSGCSLVAALVGMILPCVVVGGLGWVIWKLMEHYGVL